MNQATDPMRCSNCGMSETDAPLLALRYAGKDAWICSRCIPTLVHNPDALAETLRAASPAPPTRTEG